MPKNSTPGSGNIFIKALSKPDRLQILVTMSYDEAVAIENATHRSYRAKSAANRALKAALRTLTSPEVRQRKGLLQGNVPSEVRDDLMRLARDREETASNLIAGQLGLWIDPETGQVKKRKGNTGHSVRRGPKDYAKFSESGKKACEQARKLGRVARLQVTIGDKLKNGLISLLEDYRVSSGNFLTALILKIKEEDVSNNKGAATPLS